VTRHTLKLSCGITVKLVPNETIEGFVCEWSKKPTSAQRAGIADELKPWISAILSEYRRRTGWDAAIVLYTPGPDGRVPI
jgi:hypothetical protein